MKKSILPFALLTVFLIGLVGCNNQQVQPQPEVKTKVVVQPDSIRLYPPTILNRNHTQFPIATDSKEFHRWVQKVETANPALGPNFNLVMPGDQLTIPAGSFVIDQLQKSIRTRLAGIFVQLPDSQMIAGTDTVLVPVVYSQNVNKSGLPWYGWLLIALAVVTFLSILADSREVTHTHRTEHHYDDDHELLLSLTRNLLERLDDSESDSGDSNGQDDENHNDIENNGDNSNIVIINADSLSDVNILGDRAPSDDENVDSSDSGEEE